MTEPLMVEMMVAETEDGKFYCGFRWAKTQKPVMPLVGVVDTPEMVRDYIDKLRAEEWHVKVMDVYSEHPVLEDLI